MAVLRAKLYIRKTIYFAYICFAQGIYFCICKNIYLCKTYSFAYAFHGEAPTTKITTDIAFMFAYDDI